MFEKIVLHICMIIIVVFNISLNDGKKATTSTTMMPTIVSMEINSKYKTVYGILLCFHCKINK